MSWGVSYLDALQLSRQQRFTNFSSAMLTILRGSRIQTVSTQLAGLARSGAALANGIGEAQRTALGTLNGEMARINQHVAERRDRSKRRRLEDKLPQLLRQMLNQMDDDNDDAG